MQGCRELTSKQVPLWMWYDFFTVLRMKTHDYTWKIGLQYSSNTKLSTNKPLSENTVIIDLLDGHRYQVSAIYPAKAKDKEWSFLPDTVVHTWPAGALSEDELTKLRERAGYKPKEYSFPLEAVVFDV